MGFTADLVGGCNIHAWKTALKRFNQFSLMDMSFVSIRVSLSCIKPNQFIGIEKVYDHIEAP